MRWLPVLMMCAAVLVGCRQGPLDEPSPSGASTDDDERGTELGQLDSDSADRAVAIAITLEGLPGDAVAISTEPSFDAAGVISGAVVRVRFERTTGAFEFPGLDLMVANDDIIRIPQVVRYQVRDARHVDVAVDLASGGIRWATPDPTAVTSTELIWRSETDIEGRTIPPNAKQLEGE